MVMMIRTLLLTMLAAVSLAASRGTDLFESNQFSDAEAALREDGGERGLRGAPSEAGCPGSDSEGSCPLRLRRRPGPQPAGFRPQCSPPG